MCSPTLALALTGAGAASQTVGAYYAAQSQKDDLRRRADALEIQAQRTIEAGQRDEQRSRLATANTKGAQRAAMAGGNVDLGSGTALQTLTSTDLMGEVDAQQIRANAVRSAWGYRTEATMSRAASKSISPLLAAGTSMIGQAGQVASTWYRLNDAGAFSGGGGDGMSQGDRRRIGVY